MKLLEAHYRNAIPIDLLRSEKEAATQQLTAIRERLERSDAHNQPLEKTLAAALDLAESYYEPYLRAPERARRPIN
jgi:site-specific DNA recombinase